MYCTVLQLRQLFRRTIEWRNYLTPWKNIAFAYRLLFPNFKTLQRSSIILRSPSNILLGLILWACYIIQGPIPILYVTHFCPLHDHLCVYFPPPSSKFFPSNCNTEANWSTERIMGITNPLVYHAPHQGLLRIFSSPFVIQSTALSQCQKKVYLLPSPVSIYPVNLVTISSRIIRRRYHKL